MSETKIAFLGGLFPKEKVNEIELCSKSQPQYAADCFQRNIIDGLDCYLKEPITILNSLFIGSYPFLYKKLYIKKDRFNHSEDNSHIDYQLSFFNVPLVKHFSRFFSYKRAIKKIVLGKGYSTIVGYSMTFSVVMGLLYAKKKDKDLNTCLVVPDLPEYMNLGAKKSPVDFIRNWNKNFLYRKIQKLDSFVLLTEEMASALSIKNKPYTVIEGISSVDSLGEDVKEKSFNKKSFVYTGTIQEKYGIKDLVEAFHRLPQKDIELNICGWGDTIEYLKVMEKKDNRIHYLGVVPHSEIKQLQESAYILINPRNSNEEYTKYSFPSKIMEYMSTGRPVLMYPLKGIPKEYFFYVYLINPEENDSFFSSLEHILSLPEEELYTKGKAAQKFIVEEKNFKSQGKKLIDFLSL